MKLIPYEILSIVTPEFLKLIGIYTLLKLGYNNSGLGRYYTFYLLKKLPYVKKEINEKTAKVRNDIKHDLNNSIADFRINFEIPEYGQDEDLVIDKIKQLNTIVPFNTNKGMVSGCVYSNSEKIDKIFKEVYPLLERTNPLHPDIFPGVRKMEAEIVNMCGNLLKSHTPEVGSFTSGGTESILLAMRSYKKIAEKRGQQGEILLSKGAHAAYWKAAEYFNMNIIEVDTGDEPLAPESIENLITPETTIVVCSAPSFNYGIVDDISGIGQICLQYNLYLHVDMCLGGFLIPFFDDVKCDFDIPGITSISMDTHKYGYGPKGGSVLLYNDKFLLKNHCFIKEDWSGGIYGTSNLTGSRSGAVIGITWATMMSMGINGYRREASKIQNLTRKLARAININPNLELIGNPEVCLVAIKSIDFNIYLLCDKLKESGWCLNILQNPPSFHFCITSIHDDKMIENLIKDINFYTQKIMDLPNKNTQQSASIYGTTQKVNDPEIIDDVVREYICCLMELQ